MSRSSCYHETTGLWVQSRYQDMRAPFFLQNALYLLPRSAGSTLAYFQKNENIQRWVPAKGHTEKGAQQRRDKIQRESSTETTSRSRNGCTQKRCNHHDDGQLSEYDDCPSSSDENCSETKPQHRSHGESRKRRKQEHVYGETVSFIYCVSSNTYSHTRYVTDRF